MEQSAVNQACKSHIHEEKFIDWENKRQSLFGQTGTSYFDNILSLSAKTPNLLEFNNPVPTNTFINKSKYINNNWQSTWISKKYDPMSTISQPATLTSKSMVPPIKTMPPADAPCNGDVSMV